MATKLETLTAIGIAMQSEPWYLFVSEASVKTYVKQGLVQVDPSIQNEDFHIAAGLTQAGIDFVNSNNNIVATSATSTPKESKTMSTFEIVSDAPIPTSKRGAGLSGRKCKYPFELLEVGQMFFVPATEKQPEPAKSMVGVVSGANKRYAVPGESTKINRKGEEVPVLVYTKRFVLRPYTNAAGVAGAGVWRDR